jgi:hypothetical protein
MTACAIVNRRRGEERRDLDSIRSCCDSLRPLTELDTDANTNAITPHHTTHRQTVSNSHLLSLLPQNSNLVGSMLVILASLSTISEVDNMHFTTVKCR